jgi:hypothetical protein
MTEVKTELRFTDRNITDEMLHYGCMTQLARTISILAVPVEQVGILLKKLT